MFIGSDKRYFLSFGGGLYIVNDRRHSDQAYCLSYQYAHPMYFNGGVRQDGNRLLIAGGETKEFKAIQVDVYGII